MDCRGRNLGYRPEARILTLGNRERPPEGRPAKPARDTEELSAPGGAQQGTPPADAFNAVIEQIYVFAMIGSRQAKRAHQFAELS